MSGIDEVRARLDIVEIVGDYVQLKRSGRSYKGVCPFHDEKTPSFIVFPDSGNWRCFGACAVGGDAFEFVMRMENLDFRGALEHLAKRLGVVLEPPTPAAARAKDQRERLLEATAAAADFFHQQLLRAPSAEPAREYLRQRDFGIDAAQSFGLGWAPDEWSALADHLKGKGFGEDELLAAGLVKPRDSGGVYDSFRGRLVFPIHDAKGKAIGFGARTLDPEGIPKYLNSPQSAIFDKSHVLFGLHRAARAIRAEERAVVVEGYTDVLRAHIAGFENVVASLGTAITEHQLRALKRYTQGIVLALDADAAGQSATLRGLEVAREAAAGGIVPVPTGRGRVRYSQRTEVELAVVSMPAGKDPDDVIRESPLGWRKLVAEARPVMDYLFAVLTDELDLRQPAGKTTAAERLLPVLAEIGDPIARSAWLARLAQMIQVDEQVLGERLSQLIREERRRPKPRASESSSGNAGGAASGAANGGNGWNASGSTARGSKPRASVSGEKHPLPAPPTRTETGGSQRPGSESSADSPGDSSAPPEWATENRPLDARAASELPEDAPDWDDVAGSDGRSRSEFGTVPQSSPESNQTERQIEHRSTRIPASAAGRDALVTWLLGYLVVDPQRLRAVNAALAEDGQEPLGSSDFSDVLQRDLLAAIAGTAGIGLVKAGNPNGGNPDAAESESGNPDAPDSDVETASPAALPSTLDSLTEPLAGYAADLRERALAGIVADEVARAAELRLCVLRLRKRELERALPGLRYLMAEAEPDEAMAYAAKVVALTERLKKLTQLLSPLDERKVGKVDNSLM
jgi:DNA primase